MRPLDKNHSYYDNYMKLRRVISPYIVMFTHAYKSVALFIQLRYI